MGKYKASSLRSWSQSQLHVISNGAERREKSVKPAVSNLSISHLRLEIIVVRHALSFLALLIALVLSSENVALSEAPPQVSSLKELITRFDGSSCKECHEPIYTQWEKSHHARPLMGLDDQIFMTSYLKRGPLAVKPGEKATRKNFPCFKCHLPQIEYATDSVAAEIAEAILKDDKATLRKLNISCIVCHNEKAVVHGRPEPNILYGNKDVPDHQGQVVKKSPLLKDSLMCGQCHGLGPNLEFETPVQCATLYGSYLPPTSHQVAPKPARTAT